MWQCLSLGKDTKTKPRECWTRLLTRLQPPLLCLRPTVVIARPAAAQNPTGRNHSLRFVLCSDSNRARWLGWLPRYRPGPECCPSLGTIIALLAALAVATIKQNSCFSGFSYGLYPLTLQARTTGGQGQGYDVRARRSLSVLLSILLIVGPTGAKPPERSYHAYSLPALGPPPRLLAPGIETIEMRPCWPSSATSYPTGGSFSSSFSSALFS